MSQNKSTAQLQKKNGLIYILRTIAQGISTDLCAGAFATAFMLYIGLNTEQISVVNFSTNAGMMIASVALLYAFKWDSTGVSIVKFCSFGCILTPACLLIASYIENVGVAFAMLLILHFISSFLSSARNSAEVNATPVLFGRENYSRLLGISGIAGSLVTAGISAVITVIFSGTEKMMTYRSYFTIATACMLVYAILALLYRKPQAVEHAASQKSLDIKILFTKEYLLKSIPHMTRGVGAAGASLFVAAVLSNVELSTLENSLLVPITIAATVIGSFLLLKLTKVMKPGTITMAGFMAVSVCMVAAPFLRTSAAFFVFYILLTAANSVANKSVMSAVVYASAKDDLAITSSLHVLAYAICYCPAVLIFGKYMDSRPVLMMVIGAALYIVSALLFHYMFRNKAEE